MNLFLKRNIIRIVITVMLALLFAGVTSAEPVEEWNKTFGGANSDSGLSVQQTSDGGYIITGGTESYGAGDFDLWLVKTDSAGTQMWSKTFGGADSDSGLSVQQTSDGGYIITGSTGSYGAGLSDVWLVKTDAIGTQMWNKTFGEANAEYGFSVQQTSDGGYVITGKKYYFDTSRDDLLLIKTDSAGTQMWSKTFGGANSDYGWSVQQTSDGGYIITGGTESDDTGWDDLWLVKTDSAGTQMWSKTFGGADLDSGFSVQQTSDGGYIITGKTFSYGVGGGADFWLVKTDSAGTQMWGKTFGGVYPESGSSVQQTSDGGYIITGRTFSYGAGDNDLWLVKTDSTGTQMWNKTFGGADSDSGSSVQQTSDGGYIITGKTESYGAGDFDLWLVKVSKGTFTSTPIDDNNFATTNETESNKPSESPGFGLVLTFIGLLTARHLFRNLKIRG